MIEKELKFRVKNLGKLISKLFGGHGYRCKNICFQKTEMYDNANKLMGKTNGRIRLRTEESPSGTIYELSYKKPITREGVKQEKEHTIQIRDSINDTKEILKAMGFNKISSYEKIRISFNEISPNLRGIDIDIYPFETFCEIEGEIKTIKIIAKNLGFSLKDNLTKSCDDLYSEWCETKGIKPSKYMKF